MAKRPAVDLSALTSETAMPMPEAVQRAASRVMVPPPATPPPMAEKPAAAPVLRKGGGTPTADLQALAFKVSPAFRKRFKLRAANADMKLNELLFEALEAWELQKGLQK